MSVKESTMKEIFAASGNLCALCLHEGKQTLLVDGKGHFISEIAHIRAQNKNGPRYDASYQYVDDACNLIPLCNNCHEKIDKYQNKYTVEFLEKLKKSHEAKFTTVIRDLATIHDITQNNTPVYPQTMNKLLEGDQLSDDEVKIIKSDIFCFIDALKNLSANYRKFLAICLDKSQKHNKVLVSEIESILNLPHKQIKDLYDICNERGFIDAESEDGKEYFYLHYKHKLIDVFDELKLFSQKKEIYLSTFFYRT